MRARDHGPGQVDRRHGEGTQRVSHFIDVCASGNSVDTFPTQRLPTVVAVHQRREAIMTISAPERPDIRTAPDGSSRADTWICDNCRTETDAVRKRCADCGTSRY
jgi:hypothetical protein